MCLCTSVCTYVHTDTQQIQAYSHKANREADRRTDIHANPLSLPKLTLNSVLQPQPMQSHMQHLCNLASQKANSRCRKHRSSRPAACLQATYSRCIRLKFGLEITACLMVGSGFEDGSLLKGFRTTGEFWVVLGAACGQGVRCMIYPAYVFA